MIENLEIKNFKSIKDLSLKCKKLNVFIGDPNSGKSNLIEALALQSQNSLGNELNKDIFRYKTLGDLFFDFEINNPIEIITDSIKTILKYPIRDNGAPENHFHFLLNEFSDQKKPTIIGHDGKVISNNEYESTNVHLYEFKRLTNFNINYIPYLSVPFGENLPSLLLSNSEYKKWVSDFLKSKELRLNLKPTENEIVISKMVDDEIYSYPYLSISETLQRIIFYTIAIKSNNNNVLLFDEPDSNTFPFYTKYIAEKIALDEHNQFFITTHNPYLLLNLIEKSTSENLNLCIAQMKDFKTTITSLKVEQVEEILDLNSDAFFNFEKILGL